MVEQNNFNLRCWFAAVKICFEKKYEAMRGYFQIKILRNVYKLTRELPGNALVNISNG